MTDMRSSKVESVARFIPAQTMALGAEEGELLVIGWGSTYGPVFQAVNEIRASNQQVSYTHLRYLHPFPDNLGELVKGFRQVLVPEMNMGQLSTLLRDKLGLDPIPLCKVTGQPFLISELIDEIRSSLSPIVGVDAKAEMKRRAE